ncbi:MAG: hypothetical protein QW459_07750 [Sulfolobales archaeon]
MILSRAIDLRCTRLTIPSEPTITEGEVRRLAYSLDKFASKHFVSFVIERNEREVSVALVFSDRDPVDYFVGVLQKRGIRVGETTLSLDEVRKLVERRKQTLIESYIRLALRNYLRSNGYAPKRIGRRTLWSKGTDDRHLYIVDVDVDAEGLVGYISANTKTYSSESLWDRIASGSPAIANLQELVDSTVLVPYGGSGFAYGKISGFLWQKVSEDIETNGGVLNLYEYYHSKKGISIDPEEHPVVKIRLSAPERDKELYYPPSQVRLLLSEKRLEPRMRYKEISELLQKISSSFKPFDIAFERVLFEPGNYVDIINDVRLTYGDNFKTYLSPLRAVQRYDAKPLRGAVNIPLLVLLIPSRFSESLSDVKVFAKLLQKLYTHYNMGDIKRVEVKFYGEKKSADEQKAEFARALGDIVDKYSPKEAIVVPVVNYGYLFKVAKQICSDKYFHARVIEVDTFARVLDGARRFVASKSFNDIDSRIHEFIAKLKKDESLEVQERRLVSRLSNIVFSIYVEFAIQSDVVSKRIPRKLTWSLAEPADGEGRTLYLGFDVSRNPRSRGEVAAMFVLYDSYGNMVNTIVKQHPGEKLSREFIEDALLSLVAHRAKPEHVNRLVVFKDGTIRSVDEARSISDALQSLGKRVGLREYDVVGVVKRPNLRLFSIAESTERGQLDVKNPERGIWVKLWSISRYGVKAERALIVSSETKASGTVVPTVVEHYDISNSSKSIENIVMEYIRLCRLNFWNPLDGLSKYPLPVLMADKIAYLSALGVGIRTP